MLEKDVQNRIFEAIYDNEKLLEFEKYIYNLSLEEWAKIFGENLFLELVEYNYRDECVFNFEKKFYKIVDTSDFIKNYLIFLLKKYLEQDEDFIAYFQILWDFYLNGLSFLDYFLDYWMDENMDYSLSENEKPKILKLISDLKSWKYYNFDLDDDNDWKNYKWTNISILSAHCHRYTYDEK